MFAMIARFAATEEFRDDVFTAVEKSTEVAKKFPGLQFCQIMQPIGDEFSRVGLFLWESREHYLAMLESKESREAHASIRPEYFRETPAIDELEVLSTWHTEAVA